MLFSNLTLDAKLLPALAGPMGHVFCQLSILARSASPDAVAGYVRIVHAVSRAARNTVETNHAETSDAVMRFRVAHEAALDEMGEALGDDRCGTEELDR